jgi:hypothetical protein
MVTKMELELNDGRDWGEVSDVRLVERRMRDIAALNVLREQLLDLEYEITAEDEEAEFRRRGDVVGSYSDYFDAGDTPFGFTTTNTRSPWRQQAEQRRNPKRYDNSGNDKVLEELERLRRIRGY